MSANYDQNIQNNENTTEAKNTETIETTETKTNETTETKTTETKTTETKTIHHNGKTQIITTTTTTITTTTVKPISQPVYKVDIRADKLPFEQKLILALLEYYNNKEEHETIKKREKIFIYKDNMTRDSSLSREFQNLCKNDLIGLRTRLDDADAFAILTLLEMSYVKQYLSIQKDYVETTLYNNLIDEPFSDAIYDQLQGKDVIHHINIPEVDAEIQSMMNQLFNTEKFYINAWIKYFNILAMGKLDDDADEEEDYNNPDNIMVYNFMHIYTRKNFAKLTQGSARYFTIHDIINYL